VTAHAPLLVLGVADRRGLPISDPLFCVATLTAGFIERLFELSTASRDHQIGYLITHVVYPELNWAVSADGFSGLSSAWHVVGDAYQAELSARRRMPDGSYGKLEEIGATPLISLSDLQMLHEHGVAITFRDHESTDDPRGGIFIEEVFRRMVAAGTWPAHVNPSAAGASPDNFRPD
jgi:hypothetical protein